MGLLNSMINILGKTVAQGVGSVVEKAVSEAVKPAATKLAQKQADLIESVTKNIESANESMKEVNESMKSAGESMKEAGEALDQAVKQNPEELSAAMEFLRQNARRAAEEIKNLEVEETLTDEQVMAKWDELLPDFPKWSCGGNGFSFEEDDLGEDGKCVRFYLNAIEANYIAYYAILIANGFRQKYRSDTATWYKEVDGRYPAVHLFHVDDDACEMQLIYYFETRENILEASRL